MSSNALKGSTRRCQQCDNMQSTNEANLYPCEKINYIGMTLADHEEWACITHEWAQYIVHDLHINNIDVVNFIEQHCAYVYDRSCHKNLSAPQFLQLSEICLCKIQNEMLTGINKDHVLQLNTSNWNMWSLCKEVLKML